MKTLKVLELFGGIGACSKALERLGVNHEIVDVVEIDKYAIASFNAVHGTNFEPQDITKWDKDLQVDLIMHGSPCQDFSIAGKQAGGDEGSGTRSSLLYETLRIVEKTKPKYVIWENVKNLLSSKHRHNFDAYIQYMQNIGYNSYYKVLNAKDYGIPQNRERVFTISIRNDGQFDSYFTFPDTVALEKRLKDVLEDDVDEKYYLTDLQLSRLLASNYDQNKRIYDTEGVSPTINTMGGGQRQPKIIDDTYGYESSPREYEEVSPTLRSGRQGLKVKDSRIRKLTPKECWRLMGFDDEDFAKAEKVNSNTQLYKQAGNSIVVNVLEAIMKNLLGKEYYEK